MLVEDQEVLDRKSERFNNLPSTGGLVRGHELVELPQMQEEASRLKELLAQLLETPLVAAEVPYQQVWVDIERERVLLQVKDLLRWDSLEEQDDLFDEVLLLDRP